MIPGMSTAASHRFPIEAADLCVKCGMCLPHCPTYGATLDEAESPRGRIMLMQGLVTGRLQPGAALDGHLDRCLGCRACEAVCPADVPYGRLIDSVRTILAERRPARTRLTRLMAFALVNRPIRVWVALALWTYRKLGVQALVRAGHLLGRGKLARLESLLPDIHLPRQPVTSGRSGSGGDVSLFTNCTSPLSEPQALQSAVQLLEALGCTVTVPDRQTCCGAMHQHAGLAAAAGACARRNVECFKAAPAVVGIASGCTAQLVEYDQLLEGAAAEAFAGKTSDIHGFLSAHADTARLRFRPLKARVLLQTPCTLRNVIKGDAAVRALLARIPELEVIPMDSQCCGAAGSYFVSQPEMADRLLEPKLALAEVQRPDYVLSSNVGCSMHLAAGLRRAGIKVPVWHPVRLLAQQLDAGASPPA